MNDLTLGEFPADIAERKAKIEREPPPLELGLHRVEKDGLIQLGDTGEESKVSIDFEYNAREPRTYYTPEYPAYIDILHIWVRQTDIVNAFTKKALQELADEIMREAKREDDHE